MQISSFLFHLLCKWFNVALAPLCESSNVRHMNHRYHVTQFGLLQFCAAVPQYLPGVNQLAGLFARMRLVSAVRFRL